MSESETLISMVNRMVETSSPRAQLYMQVSLRPLGRAWQPHSRAPSPRSPPAMPTHAGSSIHAAAVHHAIGVPAGPSQALLIHP